MYISVWVFCCIFIVVITAGFLAGTFLTVWTIEQDDFEKANRDSEKIREIKDSLDGRLKMSEQEPIDQIAKIAFRGDNR